MIELAEAERIAADWIDAWNAHDLDRVMAHYADDLVFVSPLIVARTGRKDGTIRSKSELADYFAASLGPGSLLRFELIAVCAGVSSISLHYQNHRQEDVVETKVLDADGRAVQVFVHHRPS
ncbi:MAG: nuclear transport factor 2 family protein [Proteobacteria bacterium]|nr:nuclear transport factor 2 family protein [Pseudomonadota bacterium]